MCHYKFHKSINDKVVSKILNYLPSEDINSSMISPLIDPAGKRNVINVL